MIIERIRELEEKAYAVRVSIIEMLVHAGSGHTAGPLGMADIFVYLFFYRLRHDPLSPMWVERDMFVLSNGHICPVLYATMAHAGYMPVAELLTLRAFGSRLQGHPHREFLPFVETSSGPLGSGLSQAAGMAMADKIDGKKDRYIYCMLGDGELNEGQNWEAIMFASKEKLGNLIAVVDRNNIQIDGYTEDVMPLESLSEKWRAFNWHVIEVSGHDFGALDGAFLEAMAVHNRPSVIIARTIPGKGVPAFENDYHWHGMPPKKEEGQKAIKELGALRDAMRAGYSSPVHMQKNLTALRTLGGRINTEDH